MKKNSQTGAAAIYFVFILIAITGMAALSIEGGRYISSKARLGDGLEAASIAVSTQVNVRDKHFKSQPAKDVARNWLSHYITDAKNITVGVNPSVKEDFYNISHTKKTELSYFRYELNATITHESWFKFSELPSFDKKVNVTNTGVAGRMLAQGGGDFVFVADFSESMDDDDEPNGKDNDLEKFDNMRAVVKALTTKIYDADTQSTFGFIPFAKRIVIKRNNRFYCVSTLKSPANSDFEYIRGGGRFYSKNYDYFDFSNLMRTVYKDKNGEGKGKIEREKMFNRYGFTDQQKSIARNYVRWLTEYDDKDDDCDEDDDYDRNDKSWGKCSKMPFRIGNNTHIDYNTIYNHIDVARTAREISIEKEPMFYAPMPYDKKRNRFDLYDDDDDEIAFERYCGDDDIEFYNLERRGFKNKEELNRRFIKPIKDMDDEDGGTDMYQGLLAAPHQFYGSTAKNRYIIVLSDGGENNTMFSELVNHGMCDNIRKALQRKSSHTAHEAKLIYVKFPASSHDYGTNGKTEAAYQQCFDHTIEFTYERKSHLLKGDEIDSKAVDEVVKKLLDLIARSSTHDHNYNFNRNKS